MAEPTVVDAATTYVTSADTYYNGITATSGTQLLGQLHDLITTTHKTYTSYDDCKNSTTVQETDPGPDGGVLEFYTQESIYSFSGNPGTWNREHVWCKSCSNGMWKSVSGGSRNGGTDMHHIRPAEGGLNSTRGSNKFGEVNGGKEAYSKNTSNQSVTLGGYVGGGAFEPLDKVKGDVARIVMYVYTHYNTYSNVYGTTNGSQGGVFGTLNFTHIMSPSSESAAIKLLLDWNKLDPVDDIERIRNEEVAKIQGNRNPFIDNVSYAEAIWGDGTVVDPNPGPDPQPSTQLKSITLNATALTLNVGETYDLKVTPNPSNASASVNWTSSNETVATVSNGRVTANSAGTATITATSTSNSAIKATATVTVIQSSSSETGAGKVTITRDKFTNAKSGYGLYDWKVNDINGVAYIFAGNDDSMQFNTSKTSCYLASTTPTAGAIRKVTIKTTGNSSWTLFTSNQPYDGITSGNPNSGNTHTSNGGSWTVSGNDTYFALVLGGSGASYIDSIEVEY
ncbi:MAG: endonuclease, partial [Clostridia bacterium]|nr:endonuclease [Clostridia bacterium]